MNQFPKNFVLAVKAFENEFKTRPTTLQGHPRTLILSLVNNISEFLISLDIKISFNDALPPGEIYVGKFIAQKFQSVQVKYN